MAKTVKNVCSRGSAREIEHPVGRWTTVEHGATVELPDALAESLAEQTDRWQLVTGKPAAAATTTTEED